MIDQIRIVSVPVSDQERAKAFYVDTLGFELLVDEPMDEGGHWVQVGPKGAGTSLTLVTWFESMPAGSLNGLVVGTDDITKTYEELLARGVYFDMPPKEIPGIGVLASFRDLDGNGLILAAAQ